MRRTGRTTLLIAQAIVDLLANGRVVFVDHEKENGLNDYPAIHYGYIRVKIVSVLRELLGVNPYEIYSIEIRPNKGIEIESRKANPFDPSKKVKLGTGVTIYTDK